MDDTWIREHWALVGAAAAAGVASLIILISMLRQSRWGRMKALVRQHGRERRALLTAESQYVKAKQNVERLEQKIERIPPRKLDEARGALTDARRLVEIRFGALQVAENRLRTIISEEYPPRQHDALRRRYGVTEHAENRPFTFDGS
jgi:hypothetical protein